MGHMACKFGLQCCVVGLTGVNPHGAVYIRDENLAVTDLARACRRHDRVDDLSTRLVGTTTSTLTFGRKVTAYSGPRSISVCPF
jgi:hypothetical protein